MNLREIEHFWLYYTVTSCSTSLFCRWWCAPILPTTSMSSAWFRRNTSTLWRIQHHCWASTLQLSPTAAATWCWPATTKSRGLLASPCGTCTKERWVVTVGFSLLELQLFFFKLMDLSSLMAKISNLCDCLVDDLRSRYVLCKFF